MNVTGYNTKYYFEFISQNGTGYTISIKQKNFAGSAVKRNLGRAPILRKEKSGAICGTSLEIYAECKVDGEFLELYTSDPKEFLVTVDVEGGTGYDDHLWIGYVSPELYSEPDIAPPYDVQITATDGLGELKLYDYTPQGKKSLFALIQLLVGSTGLPTAAADFLLVSSLVNKDQQSSSVSTLTDTMVDLDYLEGKTHYDVLSKILESLHATIHQHNGSWMIVRECDLSQNTIVKRMSGPTLSIAALTYGQVYAKEWWVINQLDSVIEPARNKITVAQRFNKRGDWLINPECSSDTGWTKSGSVTYDTTYLGYKLDGTVKGIYTNSISQSFVVEAAHTANHVLTVKLEGYTTDTRGVKVGIHVAINTGSKTYYLKRVVKKFTFGVELDYISERLEHQSQTEFSCEFRIPYSGTMTVMISAFDSAPLGGFADVLVTGCSLKAADIVEGYENVLILNNGARGEGDIIDLAFGGIARLNPRDPGMGNIDKVVYGILTIGSHTITKWATDKVGQGDYLGVLAQDYALSVALPRLRIKGVLNTPLNAVAPFTFVNRDGVVLYAEVWERDLLNDEIAVELLSIPAATLSIESQTTSEIEGAGTQGGGGSSASQAAAMTAHAGDETLHLNEEKTNFLSHWSIVNVGTEEEPQYILKANLPVASEGDLISFFAEGYESEEPGFTRLDTWENYDNTTMAGYVLSAGLAYGMKTAIDDHETRILALEGGSSGGGGSSGNAAWGDEVTNQSIVLTVGTVARTLSLAAHQHSAYATKTSNPNLSGYTSAVDWASTSLALHDGSYSYLPRHFAQRLKLDTEIYTVASGQITVTKAQLQSAVGLSEYIKTTQFGRGINYSSNTAGHANTAITAVTTQSLRPLTFDAYGHITGYGNAVDITTYLTTTAAAQTYLSKTDASNTYLAKTAQAADSAKLGGVLASNYLTKTDAANTYLGKTAQAADSAKLGGVAATDYLTESEASQTYQTQSSMSGYLTTTAAMNTYATLEHDHDTTYAAINGNSTKDFAAKALTAAGLTLTNNAGNQLVIKYNNTYMATLLVNTAGLNITLAGGTICKVVGNVVATGGITCNAT